MKKFGCVIPVYNRVDYFKQCLDSIQKSIDKREQNLIQFVIYNDGSTDPEVLKVAKKFKKTFTNTLIVDNKRNAGVNNAIFSGFDKLLDTDVDYFMNLDADAVVSSQWLPGIRKVLEEVAPKYEKFILTTFEGGRKNKLAIKGNYRNVSKISGLNTVFSRNLYLELRNSTVQVQRVKSKDIYILNPKVREKYWDGAAGIIARTLKITLLTTVPGLAQHIGEEGLNSFEGNYLKSDNFAN